jgi:ADP-ribose pyrophosphatase YjhB (NUDIX family)
MKKDTVKSAATIRAAGGVLWRDAPGGEREIALIHRLRYGGDWTLPKGKLEEGETWRDGALREVQEETGYPVKAGALLGAATYDVKGAPKVVVYFHMALAGSERTPLDADEVAEVRWLRPADALEKLTYPLERALLEIALEAP